MSSSDKKWAQAYINDPLTAPDPSDETGPGASLRRPDSATPSSSTINSTPISSEPRRLSSNNPFRDRGTAKEAFPAIQEVASDRLHPSHPTTTSPRHSPRNSIGHRQELLAGIGSSRPRRSSSLRERFPGDPSIYPLDQLAKEKAIADRARHATKKHAIKPDTIDSLDDIGLNHYHHEGPYDATLFARNNTWKSSPVAATSGTNNEALRATPHEKIIDSVRSHRPLDGVAAYPPGVTDQNGHTYNYIEGENMMIEENAGGGAYKRWAGVQYHPDDIKGKGEPSYSIEKALKDHNPDETIGDVELQSRTNRSRSGTYENRRSSGQDYRADAFGGDQAGVGRSGSFSNRLRKRVGSLTNKFKNDD